MSLKIIHTLLPTKEFGIKLSILAGMLTKADIKNSVNTVHPLSVAGLGMTTKQA